MKLPQSAIIRVFERAIHQSFMFNQKRINLTKLAKLPCLMAATLLLMSGSWQDPLVKKIGGKLEPIPATPPEIKGNLLTPAKIELGKMLFFDPRLSASGTISCNTCHLLTTGGVDNLEKSLGHGGQKGRRNSPTVYNAVFNIAQFWDGRAANLREQAKGPVQAAVEMNNTPERLLQTLKAIPGYVERFGAVFADEAEPLTFDNVAKAIEAFEATLLTPNARFDQFLKGDAGALNQQEKNGLSLFLARGCASCHRGVNLGGASYHKFGTGQKPNAEIAPLDDKGRMAVTGSATDEYVFRAPSLRNVELTGPYFHSGKVGELKQAVAAMAAIQLDLKLKDREVEDITAFLKTLTGQFPKIEPPVLPKM